MLRRLIILLLIVGSLFGQSAFDKYIKTPLNVEALEIRDWVLYTKDTNEPYTGAVFRLYENGKKNFEGHYKDGKVDGKATFYYINGGIMKEAHYKDRKKDGKWTYYHINGKIKKVEEYKDGELVK